MQCKFFQVSQPLAKFSMIISFLHKPDPPTVSIVQTQVFRTFSFFLSFHTKFKIFPGLGLGADCMALFLCIVYPPPQQQENCGQGPQTSVGCSSCIPSIVTTMVRSGRPNKHVKNQYTVIHMHKVKKWWSKSSPQLLKLCWNNPLTKFVNYVFSVHNFTFGPMWTPKRCGRLKLYLNKS